MALLVFGLILVAAGGSLFLMGTRTESGEWDFGNPFGVLDAVDYDLDPVLLAPTDAGGLRLEFDLVRTGPLDWTWTDLDLSNERLEIGDSTADLARLSPIPSEIPEVLRLVFETGRVELREGDPLRLRMKVRIRAERFGGAGSIDMSREREQTLGAVGAWYDHAAHAPSTGVEAGGADAATGTGGDTGGDAGTGTGTDGG